MIKTERAFQKQVISYLKNKYKAYVLNIEGSFNGTPDLIGCLPSGKFFAIELKIGKKYKATPIQLLTIKKINDIGGIAFVFTYSQDWKKELDLNLQGDN